MILQLRADEEEHAILLYNYFEYLDRTVKLTALNRTLWLVGSPEVKPFTL